MIGTTYRLDVVFELRVVAGELGAVAGIENVGAESVCLWVAIVVVVVEEGFVVVASVVVAVALIVVGGEGTKYLD